MNADLVAFVTARLNEDEQVAGALPGDGWPVHDNRVLRMRIPGSNETDHGLYWPDRWNPVRVLADIKSKRDIVEHCAERLRDWPTERHDSDDREQAVDDLVTVLKCLALPYVKHPDYQQEWEMRS